MHRVYTETKRRILKLSGRYLIQDRKSYVLSIKIPIQLYLWNSIKYSKINEKHELLYKNIISRPLKYSDPWKQHVTAKKSKTSVSTTLIGLMSNFLWRQTFKNLRKKKIIRMGEKMTVRKRELNPSIWKQTRTFSSVHLRSGTIYQFYNILKSQLQGTNMHRTRCEHTVWSYINPLEPSKHENFWSLQKLPNRHLKFVKATYSGARLRSQLTN